MSIFVTVGAQMPFDRLVDAVDAWARERERTDVFAQVARGRRPQSMASTPFLGPREYTDRVLAADLLVGHAGMGTILTALEHGKPIVVVPRLARLGETRNDHQVATARTFGDRGWVTPVFDLAELGDQLDRAAEIAPAARIPSQAPPELLDALRSFVEEASK